MLSFWRPPTIRCFPIPLDICLISHNYNFASYPLPRINAALYNQLGGKTTRLHSPYAQQAYAAQAAQAAHAAGAARQAHTSSGVR